MQLYNLNQIAEHLGVTTNSARQYISRNRLIRVKKENGQSLYSESQLMSLKRTDKPLVIVYEIYESKMNYLKDL